MRVLGPALNGQVASRSHLIALHIVLIDGQVGSYRITLLVQVMTGLIVNLRGRGDGMMISAVSSGGFIHLGFIYAKAGKAT